MNISHSYVIMLGFSIFFSCDGYYLSLSQHSMLDYLQYKKIYLSTGFTNKSEKLSFTEIILAFFFILLCYEYSYLSYSQNSMLVFTED